MMQLGDARGGKLAGNLAAFGRSLRRAGLPVDSARMALAGEALQMVGLERREDVAAALESVLLSRERDRAVFREMFDSFFRDPALADKLLAQMLPSTDGRAEPPKGHARVRDALAPRHPAAAKAAPKAAQEADLDAAMTASDVARLRHADFNALAASEYHLVERLVRDIRLPLPQFAARRMRPGSRGARLHWPGVLRGASRTGGEVLQLPRMRRREQPLPLLVLVDVSGSMERYTRLLLAFLHAATRSLRQRDVFGFGTHLSDLNPAMRLTDSDAMLAAANRVIDDYAGGTQLGASLAGLRSRYPRRLVGRRTLVLLITDGLDTGDPHDLGRELQWLQRHCHRLLWLNPLLRFDGYAPLARGAAQLHAHAHGMLAVHNLEKLEDLAAGIAALLAR